MKSLIVLTGKRDYIVNKLLPSLYEVGKYNGDCLIINYGSGYSPDNTGEFLNPEFDDVDQLEIALKYEKHILFRDTIKQFSAFTTDRFRAFSEALEKLYKKYDVIMHVDGNDIEFFQPIQPLLDMSLKEICVVPEPRNNDNKVVNGWSTINSIPEEMWDAIKDKPVLNCGVFSGPAKDMYAIFKTIAKFSEHDSRFGIDQLLFNVLFYYYKVSYQEVSRVWDYHFYDEGWKMVDGKPFIEAIDNPELLLPIAIMHYAGPQPFKVGTDRKKDNWLFPKRESINKPNQPIAHKGKETWLFH